MRTEKTRFIATIIGILTGLLIIRCASATSNGTCGTDSTWTLDDKGVLIISGTGEVGWGGNEWRNQVKHIIIKQGLTTIKKSAFEECLCVESIDLPDTLVSIGDRAFFYCHSLTSINIPNNVTSIGNLAFGNCWDLTEITIPDNVSSFGNNVFSNCSAIRYSTLNSDSAKSLSKAGYSFRILGLPYDYIYLFEENEIIGLGLLNCDKDAVSIEVHEDVTSILSSAFADCKQLSSITLPESIKSIGNKAFENCPAKKYAAVNSNVSIVLSLAGYSFRDPSRSYDLKYLFDENETISGLELSNYDKNAVDINILDNITAIGKEAFKDCVNLTSITIPDNVTKIGYGAFSGCVGLSNVDIPDNVTSIGYMSFNNCTSLSSIKLPKNLTSIESQLFYNCSNLSGVIIPDKVTKIGDRAFYNCNKLKSINIPDGVTVIGYWAFMNCTGISVLTLPDSVTNVGPNPFYNCPAKLFTNFGSTTAKKLSKLNYSFYAIEDDCKYQYVFQEEELVGLKLLEYNKEAISAYIQDSVTEISNNAFSGCSAIRYADIKSNAAMLLSKAGYSFRPSNRQYDLRYLFKGESIIGLELSNYSKETTITNIQDEITSIGISAFEGSNITSIIIPDGVTNIGRNAFYNCSNLVEVTIPESIENIDSGAFTNCPAPRNYDLNSNAARALSKAGYSFRAPNRQYDLRYRNTYSDELVLTYYDKDATSAVFLDEITEIGPNAFTNCNRIPEIVIPTTVVSIDYDAFSNCPAIRYAAIDSTGARALSVAGYSFRIAGNQCDLKYKYGSTTDLGVVGCDDVATILEIPDGVTYIDDYAFRSHQKLTYVTIPDSVTYIGEFAFNGCKKIESIYFPNNITEIEVWGNYTHAFEDCPAVLYANLESDTARTLSNSGYSFRDPSLKYNLRYVPTGLAISNCDKDITSFVVPKSVTIIEAGAFSDCKDLTSLTLSDGLLTIGASAFLNCTNLTSIELPSSLTNLGAEAFKNCSSLTSIEIPESITEISTSAFQDCSSLMHIRIPEGVTRIGISAFGGCHSLKSIYLPASLTYIDKYCVNCDSLTEIHIASLETWLTLTLNGFGGNDFNYNSNCRLYLNDTELTNITIPYGVTSIRRYAFANFSNLTNIIIPDTVTSIDSRAFSGCDGLISITLPDSISEISEYAFADCPTLCAEIGSPLARTLSKGGGTFKTEDSDLVLKYTFNDENTDLVLVSVDKNAATVTVPGYITQIADYVFQDSTNLTTVIIQDGVTKIGQRAFAGCHNLISVTLPDSITDIGSYAFYECDSLLSVSLPRGITRIKQSTFCDCQSLMTVTIPEGVTHIENCAFLWCNSLTNVIIPSSVVCIEDCAFFSNLNQVSFLQDSDTNVTFGDRVFIQDMTVYCYEYSSAEGYANDNGWTVVLLDRDDISNIRSLNLEDDFRISCGMAHNLLVNVFPDQPVITWSSSNPAIVSVVDGVVNALKPGVATITASIGSLSDTVLITVFTIAESFELNYDEEWVVAKDTLELEAVNILPVGAETELMWSSSDTTIATVSSSGKVTTKKPGEVKITATDISTGFDCTALLHVCYPVSAVRFETDSQSIIPRQEKQLVANVTMRSQSLINRFVTFSSSNEGIVVVGEKTGILKGVAPGTAIITVAGNGYSDTCTVIVREPNILILPVGISIIESEAFRGMPNVDAIKLPGDLTEIADDAFDDGVIIIAPTMSNTAEWAEEHGFDVIEE